MNATKSGVTVNNEQRLFVIPCGDGYSCFGFDNCYKESKQLATRLNLSMLTPLEEEIGTLAQYEKYQQLLNSIKGRDLGIWFDADTPPEVQYVLRQAIEKRWLVRLYYGDETGRSWMDEWDMLGRVGHSTGSLKVPLLVADGQDGGGAILTNRVIKIVRFVKTDSGYRSNVLYQQKNFHLPFMAIIEGENEKYDFSVTCDGKVYARFKTRVKAQQWIDFMLGLVPKS